MIDLEQREIMYTWANTAHYGKYGTLLPFGVTGLHTIMYVCSNDLHYNVLWGRYASELKGLTKKLQFSILPRKKDFHAKLQVHFGFCCHAL